MSCRCSGCSGRSGYVGFQGYSGASGYSGPYGGCQQRNSVKKFMTGILNIGKTMKDDVKNFIIENRTIIYWLVLLLVLDQWVFGGKFREKLHELFDSLINRVKGYFESPSQAPTATPTAIK